MNRPFPPSALTPAPLIDGVALRHELTAAAHAQEGDQDAIRRAALALFKEALAKARQGARDALEKARAASPAPARSPAPRTTSSPRSTTSR